MELPKGVQRWLVDVSQWKPSPHNFSFTMAFLPQHEQNSITRYWCLKEAFVKAMGTGVGYRLDCVEFHHNSWTNIFVKVDGKELKDWKFCIFELGRRHMVCIARGHPSAATENYKKTLKQTEFDEDEYRLGLHLPNVSFVLRTVEELIPVFPLRADGIPIDIPRKCDILEAEEIVEGTPFT